MKTFRLLLLPLGLLLAATLGCPEKHNGEGADSGATATAPAPMQTREAPPAPVPGGPAPAAPAAAPAAPPTPRITPQARVLLGPADFDKLHVPGGLVLQPLAGKATTATYDGVQYAGKLPGPGLTVEWQVYGTPQEVAARLQTSLHEQPKARMLPAIGPLAFALTAKDKLTVVFADPPTRSVIAIGCGAPVCTPKADGTIDEPSLDKLVGLAKAAQQHVQKPTP